MTTATDPIEDMSRRLSQAREDAGLTYRHVEHAVYRLLGDDAPTHETIRAYHEGKISPKRVNDQLVVALCNIYNRPVAEIAPFVAERVDRLLDLVRRQSECRVMVAGQMAFDVDQLPTVIDLTYRSRQGTELALAS